MATLLLRLAAPLQSWGQDSKFETRKTNREPTKSGIIGLLAASLGIRREEPDRLKMLQSLRCGVRVDREGVLLVDFHAVHKEGKAAKDNASYITYRHYLADAVFLVGLESGDEALLNELQNALRHPEFPLFLGRRSCPPTLPLCLGIRNQSLEMALTQETPLASHSRYARLVLEAAPEDPKSFPRRDQPLSFSQRHRQYGFRAVCEKIIEMPTDIQKTEHDPFAGWGDQ